MPEDHTLCWSERTQLLVDRNRYPVGWAYKEQEREKTDKYQDLDIELQRISQIKIAIAPLTIGALGIVFRKQWLAAVSAFGQMENLKWTRRFFFTFFVQKWWLTLSNALEKSRVNRHTASLRGLSTGSVGKHVRTLSRFDISLIKDVADDPF